jgi:glycosyltransferase involved in cell wall biosynthesis
MKLYFYLKHFPLGQTTFYEGTSKAVHGLAQGLSNCGAEVVILAEGPTPGRFDSPAGYRVECFPCSHTAASFQLTPELVAYVETQMTPRDLVILNGIFHRSVYGLSKLLRRRGIAYINAPHDVYHPAMFQKNAVLKWPYWSMCEKSMLQNALAIQNLDERQGRRLRDLGVYTTCFAQPNGLAMDPEVVSAPYMPFQPDQPRAIFFGRMDSHHKGLDLLIQGFAQSPIADVGTLTLQGPDAGDLQSLMALAAQTSRADVIEFLPPNLTTASIQVLENYDIFCLPSRFEGFGLSALEAMVAGRVLMVSAEAGIACHVAASGCGVIIPPTIAGIERGFTDLLARRSEWGAMGLRGRCYALKHLQWNSIAREALSNYETLMQMPVTAPPRSLAVPQLTTVS